MNLVLDDGDEVEEVDDAHDDGENVEDGNGCDGEEEEMQHYNITMMMLRKKRRSMMQVRRMDLI